MPAIVARVVCPEEHVIAQFVRDGLEEKEARSRKRIDSAANATNIALNLITTFGFAERRCAICGAGDETWKVAARAQPNAGGLESAFGEGVKLKDGADVKLAFERMIQWTENRLKPRETHRHGQRGKDEVTPR